MISSNPKPLVRSRLERLLRGLNARSDSSARELGQQVEALQNEAAQRQVSYEEHCATLAEQARQQTRQTLTAWDEQTHASWDTCERQAYEAIVDTKFNIDQLNGQAAKQRTDCETQATDRQASSNSTFNRERQIVQENKAKFDAHLDAQVDGIAGLVSRSRQRLQQRNIRPPASDDFVPTPATTTSSRQALQELVDTAKVAKTHCERIVNQPLAKFIESGWWWLVTLAVFGIVAGASWWAGMLGPIYSVVLGACCSAAMMIGGLLVAGPWLRSVAKREFPALLDCASQAQEQATHAKHLSQREVDTQLQNLQSEHDERMAKVQQWRVTRLEEIETTLSTEVKRLEQECASVKSKMKTELDKSSAELQAAFEARRADEELASEQALEATTEQNERFKREVSQRIVALQEGGAQRLKTGTEKAAQVVARNEQWCNTHFLDWQAFDADPAAGLRQLPSPHAPIGKLASSPDSQLDTLTQNLQQARDATVLFSALSDSYLTLTGDLTHESMKEQVRNIVLRLLTTLPPGRTQVCVVDPSGLGRDFGWLMHLADFDAELVSHRVWTQTNHIARQVESLARGAEDFIQQSLRDQYATIADYNAVAGALSEPYRILIWAGFPEAIDEPTGRSLQSLLDTGARCGVVPILMIDEASTWLSTPHCEQVFRRGMHVRVTPTQLELRSTTGDPLTLNPLPPPTESLASRIISEVGRQSLEGSRVEVPLANMLPDRTEFGLADSSRSLEIPIGQSGVGRTHCLTLGTGTAQHAILAGKTGSGKSTLLHALITSAVCKYSPEALRLVLLDFKKGVEFQVYSNANLPHADIIGIESHRDFGLSALKYIDDVLTSRGELFRESRVQDIAQYNAVNAEAKLPRLMLVVDEFQELFVEDDNLSSQASLILDRIVRQGRSFGVHAILSSQTLAGAYSLPRTTLGQMAVRIALQCDPSDAQIIFAEDNPAAERLKQPGQAIYNDAGGRIEGNQPMQIGWITKHQQIELLSAQDAGYRNSDPTTNRLGRSVVFSGNESAEWDAQNAELGLLTAQDTGNRDACWCVVGDSLAIEPAVTIPLTDQPGRNALIVGGNDSHAATVMNCLISSWARHYSEVSTSTDIALPQIVTLQGSRPSDVCCSTLPELWEDLPVAVSDYDSRKVSEAILAVHSELQARASEGDSVPRPAMFFVILQVGRLRELKRGDEFSFSDDDATPDKQLEEILRDGPSVGIHTLIWSENQTTAARWLSRSALRELEIRLAMQMSANDSTNLIESVAASKLGDNIMLLFDDATATEVRFRPVGFEKAKDVVQWANTKTT